MRFATPEYVSWFVDRKKQYTYFQKMLAGQTSRHIMLVKAGPDMGKTWLLQNMYYHCQQNKIPAMFIDFKDRRPYDFLSLIRRARDQIGSSHFNGLTKIINSFTTLTVNIPTQGAQNGLNISNIRNSDIKVNIEGDFAAGNIIKDNHFYLPESNDVVRRTAESKINDAFFACLNVVLQRIPVVFIFDSYENITPEANSWLQNHLLVKMEDRLLSNVIIVIGGRQRPPLTPRLKAMMKGFRLDVFSENDVHDYLKQRNLIDLGLDLNTIYKTSGGYPGLLAKMADIAMMDNEDDEDWE